MDVPPELSTSPDPYPGLHLALALILWALAVAAIAVYAIGSDGGARDAVAAGVMVVVVLAAAVTSLLARRGSPRGTGWPWLLVMAAAAAALAGQVTWHGSAGATVGSSHALLNATAMGLFAVALGWMLYLRDRPQPLEAGLDGALMFMAATVITLHWSPAARSILADPAAFTTIERAGALAAPIATGCAVLLAGALVLLRGRRQWSAASVALAVATAFFAVAVAPLALAAGPCCEPARTSGLAFVLGWLCVGFAGLHAARRELGGPPAASWRGTRLRMIVAPAVAAVMAAIVIDSAWRGPMQQGTAVAVGVLGLVLALRVHYLLVATRSQTAERLQLAQSRALVEVSRALAGTTRLDETLALVTNWAVDLLEARAAAIELLTADGASLELRAACGLPDGALHLKFPVEGSFTGWVVRHRQPRTAADARLDPFIHSAGREILGDSPIAAAPLQCRSVALGALVCIGQRPFTHEDLQLLGALADRAAVAIENARLFRQVHHLSVTDPLTGLANRRQLERDIAREFAAARRGRRLAVVMFDLDGFKEYNDNHGHLAGDDALRAFAAALLAETRADNLAVRYGGDEFIVLLADSDCDGAEAFIERVTNRFTTPGADGFRRSLMVSAGYAEYQPDMERPEQLIAAADSALYRSKARR